MNQNFNLFLEKIKLNQDYNKIIENLFNGKKYVEFQFKYYDKYHSNALVVDVKLRRTFENLPNFSENCIYLPFFRDYDIKSYFSKYEELKQLTILNISGNTDKNISIDLNKSLENMEKITTIFNSHNVKVVTDAKKQNLRKNYNLILNFLKENIDNKNNTDNYVFINFDVKRNLLKLEKCKYTTILKDLNLIFCINKNIEDINEIKMLYPFNILEFKDKKDQLIVDIEKSIEKINLFKNMKNF